jgi:anti-sigma B factor antagonist
MMELRYSELDKNIRFIKLIGKFDILGMDEIKTRFTGYCAGDGVRVIVDLSEVDYLASIGIQLLTLNAKSLVTRRGRMVLLKPNANVKSVLEMTGVPAIIPMYDGLESAETILLAF